MYDGDTLSFLPDEKKEEIWKIRLAEIDAPETDQPCGKESAQYLRVSVGHLLYSMSNKLSDPFFLSWP